MSRRTATARLIGALCCWTSAAHAQSELKPLPPYQRWYQETLACSGVAQPRVRFEEIRFLTVPDSMFSANGHGGYVGYAYTETRTVVVLADSVWSRRLVSHEMLHLMLGSPGHGPMFDLCGL